MGIDLIPATEGDTAVRSVSAGYLWRIKSQRYGYGRSVYIKGDDGLTYVYAHLETYAPVLLDGIMVPYWKENGKVYFDLYSDSFGMVRFEEGDLVGYMGHSGISGKEHLHFEIRKNDTLAVNPLAYIECGDNAVPAGCSWRFVSYGGERFISLGLYDLAERDNRLGIYRIELNGELFKRFDAVDYSEYGKGRSVYDNELSSYSCYRYKVSIDTGANTIEAFDYKGGSITVGTFIPYDIFVGTDIIWSPPDTAPVPIAYASGINGKNLKKRIRVIGADEGMFCSVFEKDGALRISVKPEFLGNESVSVKIKFKKKEGLYRRAGGRLSYIRVKKEEIVKLGGGEYVIMKDAMKPAIKAEEGKITVRDGLSGIDISSITLKADGSFLIPERDFNINEWGELQMFKKTEGEFHILCADEAGNRTCKKIEGHFVNFLTDPFSKP